MRGDLDGVRAVLDDGGTWVAVGVAREGTVVHFGAGCDELQSLDEHAQFADVLHGRSEIWMEVRLDGRLVREVEDVEVVDGLHFRFREHGRDRRSCGFGTWADVRV